MSIVASMQVELCITYRPRNASVSLVLVVCLECGKLQHMLNQKNFKNWVISTSY